MSRPTRFPMYVRCRSPHGLFLGTGMSGHGFGIGPAMGRVLADLILGRPATHDLTRFRFERFQRRQSHRPGSLLRLRGTPGRSACRAAVSGAHISK